MFNPRLIQSRGLSRSNLVDFIHKVAVAGEMTVIPAIEGSVVLLVSPQQRDHLPPGLIEDFSTVVCNTPKEMGDILFEGFEAWSGYRNQITSTPPATGGSK